MKIFSFDSNGECRAPPLETEFIQNWASLARKSGYCRHELAKNLRVSTRTLDRYFEKHLSLSAQQWLSESRLVDAYDQVMTGKPLKEISYDLGFKQPSTFTRLFKARFGIAPSLLLGRRAAEAFETAKALSSCVSSRKEASPKNPDDYIERSYSE